MVTDMMTADNIGCRWFIFDDLAPHCRRTDGVVPLSDGFVRPGACGSCELGCTERRTPTFCCRARDVSQRGFDRYWNAHQSSHRSQPDYASDNGHPGLIPRLAGPPGSLRRLWVHAFVISGTLPARFSVVRPHAPERNRRMVM